jgi:hypothetical protein
MLESREKPGCSHPCGGGPASTKHGAGDREDPGEATGGRNDPGKGTIVGGPDSIRGGPSCVKGGPRSTEGPP